MVKRRVGSSDRTIEQAKRDLGIVSERRRSRWYWSLAPTKQITAPLTTDDGTGGAPMEPTYDGPQALPVAAYSEQERRHGPRSQRRFKLRLLQGGKEERGPERADE